MKRHALLATVLGLCAACASSPTVALAPEPPPAPRRAGAAPLPDPFPATAFVSLDRCGEAAEGFDDWIASFRQHSITQGISRDIVTRALGSVTYDAEVIALDRSQRHLQVPFEEFVESHVTPLRVKRGKQLLVEHAELLAKIHARFQVPKEIVVAIWGLETDFGKNMGATRSVRALATLAYDCRRATFFRGELSSALRILQRGDIAPEGMFGAWAGEIGQTQFLPSSYERFAVDFDGDGRADLVGSSADALASTAHYLAEHGWRGGEGYAAGSPNFAVLGEWNKSEVYRKTIVVFAAKLEARRSVPVR